MSIFAKTKTATPDNGTPAVKSHPLMGLLKSFGLDPAEVVSQIEWARKTADDTVQHFDARLSAIEAKQAECLVMLCQVVRLLANQTEHNATLCDSFIGPSMTVEGMEAGVCLVCGQNRSAHDDTTENGD